MTKTEYVPVRDVMTPKIIMIDGLTTITDALNQMRANQISSLIVERRGDADEYGLLTVKDIAVHVIEPDKSPDRVNAYEAMDKPVLSIDVKMNIRYAIRLLTKFDLTRALVLENGDAVGVVTLRDMVLRYMEQDH